MDRRGLALLASGHFIVDATTGATPALLPVFTAAFALSDLAASMVLGASLLVSSAIQPFFGLLADRRATPVFLWGGVAVGAAGFGLAGLAGGYLGLMAFIVGSGIGIAAFHPEAARVANHFAAERKATGLAWFMLGGNTGFAVGPLVAALAIPFLDARSTLVFLIPGAAVTLWLLRERARLAVPVVARAAPAPAAARAPARRTPTAAVVLLLVVTTMRTWTQFTVLALVPLLLVHEQGFSDQGAGFAVVVFSGSGAAGTLVGAALADRVGGRLMLVWTMPLVAPLLAGFLLLGGWAGMPFLALAGFVLMASFSVTVALSQEYLPDRLALAAGLMIGFGAIGSAPPGLAIFGALADAAGRGTALWSVAALPLVGGALAIALPRRRRPGEPIAYLAPAASVPPAPSPRKRSSKRRSQSGQW